jgi:hypothetical protein
MLFSGGDNVQRSRRWTPADDANRDIIIRNTAGQQLILPRRFNLPSFHSSGTKYRLQPSASGFETLIGANPTYPIPYAYFKCDEAAASAILVDSIQAFNMTGGSAVSVPGKINTAIQITPWESEGPNAHWVVNGTLDESVTVRMWVKPTTHVNGQHDTILYNDQWQIEIGDRYSFGFVSIAIIINIDPGFVAVVDSGPPGLVLGDWNHVILYFESGFGCGGQFNGVRVPTYVIEPDEHPVAAPPPITDDPSLVLGIFGPASTIYIDEIAIWKGMLTDAQMLADYNNGAGITYPIT